MGFLSVLFGGNKQDKALQQAFEHIKRVLEDEEFQLDLINPAMKEMIKNCPPTFVRVIMRSCVNGRLMIWALCRFEWNLTSAHMPRNA